MTRRRVVTAALIAATIVATTGVSAASAATAGAKRSMRVAVVLMQLPGTTAELPAKASVVASTFGATDSVADWYSEMSGGQVSVTGKVYGYYAGVRSCDIATQLGAGARAARASGYVAADYDSLVVYTPDQGCGFAGIAWVGSSGVFLNGYVMPGVMEHELGHNLGLGHAGEYRCGPAPRSASCLGDYADPTDVMGDPYLNRGFSAEHKFQLGWIPASEVRTVTSGTQTIALTASENPLIAGSTQLIRVRAADGTLVAIDRRASVGYDTGLSGVWIREVASVGSDDTELVRSTALGAGQTFADSVHHIAIKTLTDSGPSASIRVCVGPCAVSAQTQSSVLHIGPVTVRKIASGSRSSSANAAVTLTVPRGRGVVAGHAVVVSMYGSSGRGAVACRDSRGNVYSVVVNGTGAQRLIVCSARVRNALAVGSTITVTYPRFRGSTVTSAIELAGLGAVRVDRRSVNRGNRAAVSSGATTRTAAAKELVFGVVAHRGDAKFTSDRRYATVGAATFSSGSARMTISIGFRIVSAPGAYSVGGTLAAGAPWRAAVVTFFRP